MFDKPSVHLAARMNDIRPFYVMDLLAQARQLEASGRSIIHLEIGEPDFATPQTIIDAGHQALNDLQTHYTPAIGLPQLREALSNYYWQCFKVKVPARRIIITPGASGALQLALAVLVNPGDQVLMADPGYPCNRHFVRMFEGDALNVPVASDTAYQLTHELVQKHWSDKTIAVMLATPSNPTGTLISKNDLEKILSVVAERGRLLVDEIYQGLVYGGEDYTALSLSDQIFVINSFSKYFGMTGWRLGWLVVPDEYVDAVDRLAQNIFLAPPTLSQYAAMAAFTPETQAELQRRREEFRARRDYLVPALKSLGFEISVKPQGAFYLYANCSKFTRDSYNFVHNMLHQAGVAVTPGKDFGEYQAQQYVRFAYTRSIDVLEEGVKRMREYLKNQ